jgi:hypothetical protein
MWLDTHLLSSRIFVAMMTMISMNMSASARAIAIAATLWGEDGGLDNSSAACAGIGARSANDSVI